MQGMGALLAVLRNGGVLVLGRFINICRYRCDRVSWVR